MHFNEEHYNKLASSYSERWANYNNTCHDWVLKNIERSPTPLSIVDLGCGEGTLLNRLQTHIPKATLTGIDASPDMLSIAKQKCQKATIQIKNLNEYNAEKQYDIVLSQSVFHHLRDQAHHLKLFKKLAHKDTEIFFCDFAIDSWKIRSAELYWRLSHKAHYKAYSSEKLKSMIATEGFEIKAQEILKPDNFWQIQTYRLKVHS